MTNSSGFTIIELLVYLGLFGIIMTGILSGSYAVIESANRNQTKGLVQADGDFLLGKINWAMSGVTAVTMPVVGTPGSTLTTNKWDGSSITLAHNGTNFQ